jgi:hypothetical protein
MPNQPGSKRAVTEFTREELTRKLAENLDVLVQPGFSRLKVPQMVGET